MKGSQEGKANCPERTQHPDLLILIITVHEAILQPPGITLI